MPQPRHLSAAPIKEAIIDIRVKASSGLEVDKLSGLRPNLANRFPKVDKRRSGTVTIRFPPTGLQPAEIEDLGLQGFFHKSADDKLIAQFRNDGFTLNRLEPYTSWQELLPIAMELWENYCEVASPLVVTRLALRYINRIPLPSDITDMGQYLRAAPVVPSELPQDVTAFLSRITIQDPNKGLAAHIVQTLETDPVMRSITLILDIDAFRDVDLSPNDRSLPDIFGYLHDFKNLVFFSYLTDATLRRFE